MAEKKNEITVGSDKGKQAELQQKVILYQILNRHLEELKQEAGLIERRFLEVETTKQIVGDLKKRKDNTEIMIPLGSGCFVKGTAESADRVLFEIGGGVFVHKKGELAENALAEKTAEIDKAGKDLQKEMEDVVGKMNSIALELQGKR
jgi:prefoldin alpha subunit